MNGHGGTISAKIKEKSKPTGSMARGGIEYQIMSCWQSIETFIMTAERGRD